jgi:hypothetical protein
MNKYRFEAIISKVKLNSFLQIVSKRISSIFQSNSHMQKVTLHDAFDRELGEIYITPWDLSDIAFYAIKYSHDFNSWIPDTSEFNDICKEYLKYDEENDTDILEQEENDQKLMVKLFWGLSQKQFWYQNIHLNYYDYNRQVEMLEIIPLERSINLDLDKACLEITGFKVKDYRILLKVIAAISLQNCLLTSISIEPQVFNNSIVTSENIKKVITFLSIDYNHVRKSPLREEVFQVKPFVTDIYGNVISINQYFILKKMTDGPLWAIRDAFKNKKTKVFLTEYGTLFEYYVEKLLKEFLKPGEYIRIKRNDNEKLADWIIYTDTYQIIIEQKAYLPEIGIRKKRPDYSKIEHYFAEYTKAFEQLSNTEKKYTTKLTTIKLILHYDQLNIANGLIKDFFRKTISDVENTFFIDIHSFEWLVTFYTRDKTIVDSMLTMKLQNERKENNHGYEFYQIIPELNANRWRILHGKFNHIRDER